MELFRLELFLKSRFVLGSFFMVNFPWSFRWYWGRGRAF